MCMCLDQEIRQSPLLVVCSSVIVVIGLTIGLTVGYMLSCYFNLCALSRATDMKVVAI